MLWTTNDSNQNSYLLYYVTCKNTHQCNWEQQVNRSKLCKTHIMKDFYKIGLKVFTTVFLVIIFFLAFGKVSIEKYRRKDVTVIIKSVELEDGIELPSITLCSEGESNGWKIKNTGLSTCPQNTTA